MTESPERRLLEKIKLEIQVCGEGTPLTFRESIWLREIDALLAQPESAAVPEWVSAEQWPETNVPVQLLHRDGSQWVGHVAWETPTWEDTFTAYRYYIDREEREMWEHGDITHWHPLAASPTNKEQKP